MPLKHILNAFQRKVRFAAFSSYLAQVMRSQITHCLMHMKKRAALQEVVIDSTAPIQTEGNVFQYCYLSWTEVNKVGEQSTTCR